MRIDELDKWNEEWKTRVEKLTASVLKDFFPSGLAFEPDCEMHELCSGGELAYKGFNIRSLAVISQLAPFTSEAILRALGDTAKAMVIGCSSGESGRRCQFYWLDLDPDVIIEGEDPITTGVGETANALSAFSNLLIREAAAPGVTLHRHRRVMGSQMIAVMMPGMATYLVPEPGPGAGPVAVKAEISRWMISRQDQDCSMGRPSPY